MASFRLSSAAQTDIFEILVWSQTQFGEAARRRYERLIVTALTDIVSDPVRPGSIARPELGPNVRTWHLQGSRERARSDQGMVRRPRHFIIYSPIDPTLIAVGRILHDAMELERHLPVPGNWG